MEQRASDRARQRPAPRRRPPVLRAARLRGDGELLRTQDLTARGYVRDVSGRARNRAVRLAAFQLLDAVGNSVVSRRYLDRHLDHLGVPSGLRPLLTPIKLTTAGGLLVGLRVPAVGALTAAGLVA